MDLEYGIIGNCRTAALVSSEASIDWLCFPRFDSTSLFAKILDVDKGGSFSIVPVGDYKIAQEYLKDTNVLKTTFSNGADSFEVIDFFPHYKTAGGLFKESELYRILHLVSGSPSIRVLLKPRFYYGRIGGTHKIMDNCIDFSDERENLYVYSDIDKQSIIDGTPTALKSDSYVMISYNSLKDSVSLHLAYQELSKTSDYWKSWIEDAVLPKTHRDMVARSALALRLLTYDDSGAIVAAATTSIPEIVGGVRNWDYRYCWIRDASFTVLSLIKIMKMDVAYEFLTWLEGIFSSYGVHFQVLFKVNGDRNIEETTLDYLAGYKNSKPVRIGNAAYKQKQLDIFGEMLDALHLFYLKYYAGQMIDEIEWELIYSIVETAIREWKNTDSSIWEFRGRKKHFTMSKVLCWTAVDRGIKIARHYGKTEAAKRWSSSADAIREDIMEKGWNEELGAFTQAYGSEDLDASVLLMPYFGFLPYKDLKMVSTIDAVKKELFDGRFVMRYKCQDDFGIPKNALIACTFWLVDALNGIGERKEALELFDNTVRHMNHLGLLSEDINRETGELLGNFPQAYSHIALINTAMDLFG
ncbi:MAG: glycoside hydrolase family 15 protein [Candidatus Marsarchaeota archaeon]|nr:glycoside hydrolase family 15 protein [Candidatus Marsarchaeota archaeon]MCL5114978.1 glycoside hydrolase family 15 protein [Candidatus Marsarchaeota archaeon]